MDVSTTELWRGFDAWLNRDSSRSPDEITPKSAICFVCDCLHDVSGHFRPSFPSRGVSLS
jgi:hypothetical protein